MEKPKFNFNFNQKLCKGCGICSRFCPKNVLDKDEDNRPILARQEDCIGCKMCEMRCPDYAIRIIKGE